MNNVNAHSQSGMKKFFKELLENDTITQKGSIYEWRNADQEVHAYDYGDSYQIPIALMNNLRDEGFVRDDSLTEYFDYEGFELTMTVWRTKRGKICDWMCPLTMYINGYMKSSDERVLIEYRNDK